MNDAAKLLNAAGIGLAVGLGARCLDVALAALLGTSNEPDSPRLMFLLSLRGIAILLACAALGPLIFVMERRHRLEGWTPFTVLLLVVACGLALVPVLLELFASGMTFTQVAAAFVVSAVLLYARRTAWRQLP